MKKRILSVILALSMLLMTGCSAGDPEETTVPDTQEAVPSAQTESPAVVQPEATAAATEPEVPELLDVTGKIHVPFLETVGDAVLADAGTTEDNTAILLFRNADEDDLELFLTLCSYCGLFRYGGVQKDGTIQYYLLRPGSAYIGCVMLDADTGELLFETAMEDVIALEAPQMQQQSDYYMQDFLLPSGYGPNVHPEFFASIGRTGADSAGQVNNIFGKEPEKCWREVYAGVTYPILHQYLSDMMLCGFDIWYDTVEFGDNGVLDQALICLDNGTSSLVIVYYAGSGMANLFYQPGVDRYLLKNADYAKYMPQK